jgi:hypothetical protein
VVADGGFKIEKDEKTGEHLENLQELYSARIILSEFLIAIRTLAKGGSFVCKLFDCFSDFTVSLLFLVCSMFKDVRIQFLCHLPLVPSLFLPPSFFDFLIIFFDFLIF